MPTLSRPQGAAQAHAHAHGHGPLAPGSIASGIIHNANGIPQLSRKFVARRISEGETGRLKEELKCQACGKGYKHVSSLAKHLWEHTPEWNVTNKLLISKHQQVQLLEAASILVSMNEEDEDEAVAAASAEAEAEGDEDADDSSATSSSSARHGSAPLVMSSDDSLSPEADSGPAPNRSISPYAEKDRRDVSRTTPISVVPSSASGNGNGRAVPMPLASTPTPDVPVTSARSIQKHTHTPLHGRAGAGRRFSLSSSLGPASLTTHEHPVTDVWLKEDVEMQLAPGPARSRRRSTFSRVSALIDSEANDGLQDPADAEVDDESKDSHGVFGDME